MGRSPDQRRSRLAPSAISRIATQYGGEWPLESGEGVDGNLIPGHPVHAFGSGHLSGKARGFSPRCVSERRDASCNHQIIRPGIVRR